MDVAGFIFLLIEGREEGLVTRSGLVVNAEVQA